MKKIIRKIISFLLIFCLLALSSCADDSDNDNIKISASFFPVYIFTMNLLDSIEGCELSYIGNLSGGCLHDYQLTTKDMKILTDCDLFVINGAGMEGFIEKAMNEIKNLNVVDSSVGISLIEGECKEDSHAHEHDKNSHIWMSVSNAIKQIENIYTALKEILPEHAEKLTANKEAYEARLYELDSELRAALLPYNEPIITFHSAYAYFAAEYQLNILATIEAEEGGEPSAKELAELVELIKQNNVKSLFIEPEYEGSAAEILANQTSAKIYTLNPISSGEEVKTAYEDIMRGNMAVILQVGE